MTDDDGPVLELRVHGVGSSGVADLLDVPIDAVVQVAGDALGGFWRPTDRRGVPDGIVREAYSWGGMVRSLPALGRLGPLGAAAAVLARVIYALLLPFSLTTVAQWTWAQGPAAPTESGTRRFAAAVRLFGLLLTLIFTSTALTIVVDVGVLQCAASPTPCGAVGEVLAPLASWTPRQRLALGMWPPAFAVGMLWLISAIATVRYDVSRTPVGGTGRTLLAAQGFWSTRMTTDLASAHLAAAIAVIAGCASLHTAVGRDTGCLGAACADPGDALRLFAWLSAASVAVLTWATVSVLRLPTTAATAPPRPHRRRLTACLLVAAVLVLVATTVALSMTPGGSQSPARLYGADALPLVLITAAALIAATGVRWRPSADRGRIAWRGCGPAVVLAIALALAVSTSAIVIVAAANLANGRLLASALVHDAIPGADTVTLSSSWVALATCVLIGLVVAIGVVGVQSLGRRDLTARAARWGADTHPPRPVARRRGCAARLQPLEPALGTVAICSGTGLLAGAIWSWAAALAHTSLWGVLAGLGADVVRRVLDLALPLLSALGVIVVVLLAVGFAVRPLAIVWDVVCALPRTGHPFGPPCYAQRAVPEIAGRISAWLAGDAGRRVVLAAHSMGGVLAVSAIATLQGGDAARTRLLTFGVQLRPLFGRMFPELFGAAVLGTVPAPAPRAGVPDPWAGDQAPALVGSTLAGPVAAAPVRWISLWRLTDFLGFPAAAGSPNPIDAYAEETDEAGAVQTHAGYTRTPAYAAALAELAG